MTDTLNHPTCQQVTVLDCVDDIFLALEGIVGLAQLLRRAVASATPIGEVELFGLSNAVHWNAGRCDHSLDMWYQLPGERLPISHYHIVRLRLETLHQQAEFVAQAGDAAAAPDLESPTADHLASLAARLIEQAEVLNGLVSAAHAAGQEQPPGAPLH